MGPVFADLHLTMLAEVLLRSLRIYGQLAAQQVMKVNVRRVGGKRRRPAEADRAQDSWLGLCDVEGTTLRSCGPPVAPNLPQCFHGFHTRHGKQNSSAQRLLNDARANNDNGKYRS